MSFNEWEIEPSYLLMTFRNYKPAYARKLILRGLMLYGRAYILGAWTLKHQRLLFESKCHLAKAIRLCSRHAKLVFSVLFPESGMDCFEAFSGSEKLELVEKYLLPSCCGCRNRHHRLECWMRGLPI